jgi:hypothetical protein
MSLLVVCAEALTVPTIAVTTAAIVAALIVVQTTVAR